MPRYYLTMISVPKMRPAGCGLMLDVLGLAVQHVVPPHEAARRRILDRLECGIESLLAFGGIERHAFGGKRLSICGSEIPIRGDPPVSKYCDSATDGSTTEPRPM